jgi:ClpP class serine protease
MNDMFVAAVAKQRGTSTKTVNADFGQGRCFTAKQALAAGMIDRIATLEDTLKRSARRTSARAAVRGERQSLPRVRRRAR